MTVQATNLDNWYYEIMETFIDTNDDFAICIDPKLIPKSTDQFIDLSLGEHNQLAITGDTGSTVIQGWTGEDFPTMSDYSEFRNNHNLS